LETILENLVVYGYLILALYSFGGGMIALAGAGILSSMGKMDITTSIVVATFFNFIGDSILFWLAKSNKKEVMGYLSKYKRKIAYTNLIMKKFGIWAVFIQKYIYGVKTLVPIIMGMSKFDLKKFIFLNFWASILWGLLVGLLSYYFSSAVRAFWG
jgi:membrane protein DedA with SNARE-associated domain